MSIKYRLNKTSSILIITLISVFSDVIYGKYVLMCYYGIYYNTRLKLMQQEPERIQPFLCTHIIYNYAKIHRLEVTPGSKEDQVSKGYEANGLYARLNNLKTYNSELKTLLSIGGATPRREFVNTVATEENMDKFAKNAAKYVRKWNFDGLTLDWEYPNKRVKAQYTVWCKKIMEEFTLEAQKTGKPRLLLTLSVQKGDYAAKFYEMDKLAEHVDIIHLNSFDYLLRWPPRTMPDTSVRVGPKSPVKSLEHSIDFWLGKNVPKNKLVAGLSTYARTFSLFNTSENSIGSLLVSHGKAGPDSKEVGYLFFTEVCELLVKEHYEYVWDEESQTPYAYLNEQWITYDNIRSFKVKADLIKKKGLAGASILEITQDDYKNVCGEGLYPLIGKIHLELFGKPFKDIEIRPFAFTIPTITTPTTAPATTPTFVIEREIMPTILTGKIRTSPAVDQGKMKKIVTAATMTTAYIASRCTIMSSPVPIVVVSAFQISRLLSK